MICADRRHRETGEVVAGEAEFLELVLQNANNRVILERAGRLGMPDWWLTAGAVFQSVWNGLTGRHADAGILDYDLFYFNSDDLSAASEQRVQRDATRLFETSSWRFATRRACIFGMRMNLVSPGGALRAQRMQSITSQRQRAASRLPAATTPRSRSTCRTASPTSSRAASDLTRCSLPPRV